MDGQTEIQLRLPRPHEHTKNGGLNQYDAERFGKLVSITIRKMWY